jgi:hypothetical protein
MVEIAPIDKLKPLELVFPNHLRILSEMINTSGFVNSPIIADSRTGVVLDGSHRYIYFLANGYKEAPVKFVNYMDENIRVGTHLMHRHIIDDTTGISKKEVLERGISGKLFPPRTTRNFFPFRKNTFADVALETLKRGDLVNCDKYISNVSIEEEIDHNKRYIQEIEFESDEIIKYMEEIRLTKNYLQKQVSEMSKQ